LAEAAARLGPVIAPGNLMSYRGAETFPQWIGKCFINGLARGRSSASSLTAMAPKPPSAGCGHRNGDVGVPANVTTSASSTVGTIPFTAASRPGLSAASRAGDSVDVGILAWIIADNPSNFPQR